MLTERRIFQVKTGGLATLVNKIKEIQQIIEKCGGPVNRIYTDFSTEHTNRVVLEFDLEIQGGLDNFEREISEYNEFLKLYDKWFKELQPLIEGTIIELWRREG